MIIAVYPTDLLISHNWNITHVLFKIQPGNFNKHWIRPLPGFDLDKYPFLVCSGRENYNLINVKTFKMEKFVMAPNVNIRFQSAFFFMKEDYGFSMHFTTKE